MNEPTEELCIPMKFIEDNRWDILASGILRLLKDLNTYKLLLTEPKNVTIGIEKNENDEDMFVLRLFIN